MKLEPDLEFAQDRLNHFIEHNLHEYAYKRNYDYSDLI